MKDAGPRPAARPGSAPGRMRGPIAALGAAAAGAGYVLAVRPRLLRSGATAEEAAAPMAGDQLVPVPRMQSTRAVTITAPVSAVWPWLIQLGAGRGGCYSYDGLETAAGLDSRSAGRHLPDLQGLRVGDLLPLSPDAGLAVRILEPEAVLGLGGTLDLRTGRTLPEGASPAGPRLVVGWTLVLRPVGTGASRLLSRTRYDYSPLAAGVVLRAALEPAQFVLERRMLLGIRARAEGRAVR